MNTSPRPPTVSQPRLMQLALLACLVLLGVRAIVASATFVAPGGAILGWSKLPTAHCAVCAVRVPAAQSDQTHTQPLTPETYAALLTQRLSLDEELGQLMMVQIVGQNLTPDAVEMVNAQGAGGIIFFAANIGSGDQIRSLTTQLQKMAQVPLLLSVDQEGGTVNRFYHLVGPLPSAASLTSPAQAQQRGQQDAALLHRYGFNLDLAPVVDVGTRNPELWGRIFGSSPERVATMAGAYLDGLQQSGLVTGCLKHYPGIGDTTTDPHVGMPVLNRSRADWESSDLAPYRTLLKNDDVRAIMVTHEMIPAIDPNLPSSLSPAILAGVLRHELGYNGVVITDSLYMGALNQHWSVSQAIVLAIVAGADIVIGPYNPQMVRESETELKQALSNGTLTHARIDASVQRILALKIRMGLIPLPQQSPS
ncbi:MAG TPA: glycoside hydrolase family 3 protein [Ktedonobacterales bacterium]|nr:glycoside hydrolase family 3 protein [Ktedonobacterales bacterium]